MPAKWLCTSFQIGLKKRKILIWTRHFFLVKIKIIPENSENIPTGGYHIEDHACEVAMQQLPNWAQKTQITDFPTALKIKIIPEKSEKNMDDGYHIGDHIHKVSKQLVKKWAHKIHISTYMI